VNAVHTFGMAEVTNVETAPRERGDGDDIATLPLRGGTTTTA
jgi:hypothetical protein